MDALSLTQQTKQYMKLINTKIRGAVSHLAGENQKEIMSQYYRWKQVNIKAMHYKTGLAEMKIMYNIIIDCR